MKPVNNKSLIHFLFDQMEKLNSDQIDVQKAKAQANLAKQVNNSLRYELDRSSTLLEIDRYNRATGSNIELRNAEGKGFE